MKNDLQNRAHRSAAFTVAALSAGVCPQALSLTHVSAYGMWEPWVETCTCHPFGVIGDDWWVVSQLAERVILYHPEGVELEGLEIAKRLAHIEPGIGEPFYDAAIRVFGDLWSAPKDDDRGQLLENATAQFHDFWCKAIDIVNVHRRHIDDLAKQLYANKEMTADEVSAWWQGVRIAA